MLSKPSGARRLRNGFAVLIAWLWLLSAAVAQEVVLNEIMYHPPQPAFGPEPVGGEYLEFFNRGSNPVHLAGWRLDQGVAFSFPDVTLEPGGFLVVAADLESFQQAYPFVTDVVGGWAGHLGNNGDPIRLVDALGRPVETVRYASEGDWATRQRSPNDFNHRGWQWTTPADGGGASLQLRHPALDRNAGQNWTASIPTPGTTNALLSDLTPPLILEVAHSPLVPASTQAVVVTARLIPTSSRVLAATLFFRNDSLTPPPFNSAPMQDDGAHGDGLSGDGVFGAVLSPQANSTVVEFYVEAVDEAGLTNQWPPPPLPAFDETNLPPRVPYALYQVDNSTSTGSQPLYRLILIESERAELAALPCTADQESNAEFNGTFLSTDPTGGQCRYLCGFRNRGNHTRCSIPPNYRVHFPNDRPWQGRFALDLNAAATHVQILGATLLHLCGVAGYESYAAQVRVNGANLANPSGSMFGSYAANEAYDSAFAARQFPADPNGNLYRVNRNLPPPDFVWRGDDPTAYTNTYRKATHRDENDWSDLIALHRVLGADDLFTPDNVRAVANVEQWILYLAAMALLGDAGTVLNTGFNDDYALYRGVQDPRFVLLYHDLGAILGVLDADLHASTTNLDLFGSTANQGAGVMLGRFLHHPAFEPLYYSTLQRLLDTTFAEARFNAVVDQTFANYPQTTPLTATLGNLKNWMNGRRAFVQAALAGHLPSAAPPPLALLTGEPRSPTPFPNATLTVSGTNLTHYRYRLNGGAWSAEVPLATPIRLSNLPHGSTNTVAVVGRDATGASQSLTNPTLSRPWVVRTNLPPVRLNEVLARNDAALPHGNGFPDWIELYNEGPETLPLSGLRLTQDPRAPDQFSFPPGTTLAGGAFLILYADQPDGSPGLHLGFALNQLGDAVHLFDRATNGNVLLDSVTFGRQVADLSIGRFGAAGAWVLARPTPGATNTVVAVGQPGLVRLNEWLALGTLPYADDFLELFNPGPQPVALGGCYLSDAPIGSLTRHRVADLTFLEAGGHAVFLADGDTSAGANHLGFRLAAESGEISLAGPDLTVLDQVTYGPQWPGVAQGRCPDGSLKIASLTQPTPGYDNFCPSPPVAPLVNLVPITNVWRYNQTETNLGTAWREPAFVDSNWPAGPALLGRLRDSPTAYLPDPILTPLNVGSVLTYYFRTHFLLPSKAGFAGFQLSNLVDDGAVFYVNGHDAGRFNLGGGTIGPGTPATTSVLDGAWKGPVALSSDWLVEGDNVLAVEVHQYNLASTDVMFGLRLDGLLGSSTPSIAGLVLNEVLADHGSSPVVPGTPAEWIELFNASTNTLDLADLSLSDSAADPRRWVFPSPTLFLPKTFLVIGCDPSQPPSSTNTGFGLKSSGEVLYLFNSPARGGAIIDSIAFGLQTPGFSLGRLPDGRTNWFLCLPVPGGSNTAASLGSTARLLLNEWMALPVSGDDWFELYNPEPQPVALGGCWLSDELGSPAARMKSQLPPLSFLGRRSNAFARFHADKNPAAGADHVNFKLDGDHGDSLGLSLPDGTLLDGLRFGPQTLGASEGRLPDGGSNFVRFADSSSPGAANYLLLSNVVINEVLAHSDLPLEDAIELHNLSDTSLDLGGWYLSDQADQLRKFLFPPQTLLPPGGFLVCYESEFNSPGHPTTAFALSSSHGDQVYLAQASAGQLTGYRAQIDFGPSENGVSLGRFATSAGVDFVPMSCLSLGSSISARSPTNFLSLFRAGRGATNPYPKVGPVVLTEIMYHPPDSVIAGITNDNLLEEFLELANLTPQTVPLYDPAAPTNGWRFNQAVNFHFNSTHSLPPYGHLLVVSFDPLADPDALAAFQARYGSSFPLAGPYRRHLDNHGERIELLKPDSPQADGSVPYVLVEQVAYRDRAPWPTNADGRGASLQRLSPAGYANDPTNWIAAAPTPGRSALTDTDADGLADDWETRHGLDPSDPTDATQDADNDGLTNLQEYLSGTDPRDPTSYLRIELPSATDGQATLQFLALAGHTYAILCRPSADPVPWQLLTNLSAPATTHPITVLDPTTTSSRFYRLVTPVPLSYSVRSPISLGKGGPSPREQPSSLKTGESGTGK